MHRDLLSRRKHQKLVTGVVAPGEGIGVPGLPLRPRFLLLTSFLMSQGPSESLIMFYGPGESRELGGVSVR